MKIRRVLLVRHAIPISGETSGKISLRPNTEPAPAAGLGNAPAARRASAPVHSTFVQWRDVLCALTGSRRSWPAGGRLDSALDNRSD